MRNSKKQPTEVKKIRTIKYEYFYFTTIDGNEIYRREYAYFGDSTYYKYVVVKNGIQQGLEQRTIYEAIQDAKRFKQQEIKKYRGY